MLVNEEILKKNIIWNLRHVALQFCHAESVNGKAKSGYYKVAIIIAASVTEALVYRLLSDKKSDEMPLESWKCFSSQLLPTSYKTIEGFSLSICKRR